MGRGAIERKERRIREAALAAAQSKKALTKGPDPMLTVRLAGIEPDDDLSDITAEAYPVEEDEESKPKPKKRKKAKKDADDQGS